MHPFQVQTDLDRFGFWYTYWKLRAMAEHTRWQAIWLIWIAWHAQRYMDKK